MKSYTGNLLVNQKQICSIIKNDMLILKFWILECYMMEYLLQRRIHLCLRFWQGLKFVYIFRKKGTWLISGIKWIPCVLTTISRTSPMIYKLCITLYLTNNWKLLPLLHYYYNCHRFVRNTLHFIVSCLVLV